MKVLVIPVEGPLYETDLNEGEALRQLQELVGGYIQALPLPEFRGSGRARDRLRQRGGQVGRVGAEHARDRLSRAWGRTLLGRLHRRVARARRVRRQDGQAP